MLNFLLYCIMIQGVFYVSADQIVNPALCCGTVPTLIAN